MEHLFQPVRIGNLNIKNRIVMPPIHHNYTPDGYVNQRLIKCYTKRAAGGAGLIIVGGCSISQVGLLPGSINLQDDNYLPGLRGLTAAIHTAGSKVAAQLYMPGRYAFSRVICQQSIAPSPIASRLTSEMPREIFDCFH